MSERIDFGELPIVPNGDIAKGDVWMGPAGTGPSLRLIEAFGRGETTEGGMAEAGWRYVGTMAEDGITMLPPASGKSGEQPR